MKVLVTGAAGFIGSHLAGALIEEGHQVVGIDDLSTGRQSNFPLHGSLHVGDIRSEQHLKDLGSGWDVIYHCAASYKDRENWERDASTNVLGTINVVRAAQRSQARIVYFQTSLCYGRTDRMVPTIAPLAPEGSYAVSKTAGERYIADSGVPYVSLRLANIYGPRNLSGPIPAFYQRLSTGKQCTIVNTQRDFVFIDDLVQVALKALLQGSGAYHVASGKSYWIRDAFFEVARAMNLLDADGSLVDTLPEEQYQSPGSDDMPLLLLDPTKTVDEFGLLPRTPFGQGVDAAVGWYRKHGVTETFTHLAGVSR